MGADAPRAWKSPRLAYNCGAHAVLARCDSWAKSDRYDSEAANSMGRYNCGLVELMLCWRAVLRSGSWGRSGLSEGEGELEQGKKRWPQN